MATGRSFVAGIRGWLRGEGIPFRENAPISPHLLLRIGGPVRLLVAPADAGQRLAVLQRLTAESDGERLPLLVLGGGSNIAFPDEPVRAAVVLPVPAPPPPALAAGARTVEVDAGTRNQSFLAWCADHGAGGFEFLSGIPGTLGGAAAVNAGAFGRSISDVLLEAEIVDGQGARRCVDAGYFDFRYRDSRFKMGGGTALALRLRFEADDPEAISRRSREHLEYRRQRHPSYRLASAGCFFKNPLVNGTKQSAGRILEECGLKETALGPLYLAREHANFVINRGGATFAELQRLEEEIRAAVAARTGIELEREVIFVTTDGRKY